MPILEKEIEAKVVKWAETKGFVVLKLNNQWSRGWPDRLFISPLGKHIYIEFKRPGGRLRKLQRVRHKQLSHNCCLVFICDSIGDAFEILGSQAGSRTSC